MEDNKDGGEDGSCEGWSSRQSLAQNTYMTQWLLQFGMLATSARKM